MKYYSASNIKEDPVVWGDINETGRHYVKRNKPDTERKILHDLIDLECKQKLRTKQNGDCRGESWAVETQDKEYQGAVRRRKKPRDLMYRMKTIVKNTLSYTENLL